MTDYMEKKCPKCGQKLRFPVNIGGMLMACPSCGKKFYSDFKLAGTKRNNHCEIFSNIFEMPSTIVDRIGKFFNTK